MSLSARQLEGRLVREVRDALARPALLHVTCEILVHEPADVDASPCPCCGSTRARIVERRPDGEVLIRRRDGRRFKPDDLTAETWSRALKIAEHHDVRLRCSGDQLALVLDDSDRSILAAGPNRSGKTMTGLMWMARQWVHRGGALRRFWFVGRNQDRAFHLLRKWIDGDGASPGFLPPALVVRRPTSHRAATLDTVLADGSIVQLRFFGGDKDAENLKGDPIVAAVVDEAATMKHKDALTALRGRCLDLRGRLWLATTPTPGSFLKEEIVEKVAEWDRLPPDHPARTTGAHPGAEWISASLSVLANPWQDLAFVRQRLAASNPDDPSTRRDFFGEWVTGAGRLWRFDPDKHVFLHEARRVDGMRAEVDRRAGRRQVRVTDRIVRRLFQTQQNPHYQGLRASNTAYILGGDVNVSPQSTVVLEVTADAEAPDDRDRWHMWVIDVVQTFRGHALAHAEYLASTAWARSWAPGVTESPYRGCGIVIDPQALHRDPTAHRYGGNPQGIAEVFGDNGFDARAPQYKVTDGGRRVVLSLGRRDTHLAIHRLIDEGRLHVSARALPLIKALCEQEAGPDGIQPLDPRSHTAGDRRASSVDALRYAVHAILYGGT